MKQERLNLYTIDMKYVRDLAKSDSNVMSVSPQSGKDTRPFAEILILVDDKKYCVPITSPKAKTQKMKNAVDLMKIRHPTRKDENGAFEVIGVLNFNNMLPIDKSLLSKLVSLVSHPFIKI